MYKALVSVRYPELVALTEGGYQIGHFVPHPHTDQHGGFLTVFWDVPLDLTTCQLLVLRNRDLLLQHGFTSEWEGGITGVVSVLCGGSHSYRVAVVVRNRREFLSGNRHDATPEDREDCYGRGTFALSRSILITYMVSSYCQG